jgi:hypothetical protein
LTFSTTPPLLEFWEAPRLIVPTSTFAFPNPSPILYTRAFIPWAGSATTELLLEGPTAYQCLSFLLFPSLLKLYLRCQSSSCSGLQHPKMDRRLDPHLQRIVDNATGMNNNKAQEGEFTYFSEERQPVDWSFRAGPVRPPQEHTSFNEFGQLPSSYCALSPYKFSTSDRVPLDGPYHTHPPPFTGSNRVSLAPRNIYNQPDQEPRTLSNADNHFRFTQNLREGAPMNPALPRPNMMQQSEPTAPQRSTLFSQRHPNSQSLDSIDHLANAMWIQKSVPPLQTEPAPPNFFHRRHPSGINRLQPQRQQVTPPFNLSKSLATFLCL